MQRACTREFSLELLWVLSSCTTNLEDSDISDISLPDPEGAFWSKSSALPLSGSSRIGPNRLLSSISRTEQTVNTLRSLMMLERFESSRDSIFFLRRL